MDSFYHVCDSISMYHRRDKKKGIRMESVLNLLMLRFALIAGGLVMLALIVFAVALALERRGRLGDVRRYAGPAARAAVRHLEIRTTRPAGRSASGVMLTALLRAATRAFDGQDRR